VTLTGPGAAATSDLWIAGDGRIVNKADLSGHMFAMADSALAADGVGVVTSFTNDGDLSGGFEGGAHSFTNNGAIGPFTPTSMAVDLSSSGDLDFSNHGTIAAPFAVRMFLADARPFFPSQTVALLRGMSVFPKDTTIPAKVFSPVRLSTAALFQPIASPHLGWWSIPTPHQARWRS
jgi:hypothetical protein